MMKQYNAIERLLYREARFLDEHRFDEWLDLYSSDAIYWIPAGHFDIDPEEHVSIIYDTRVEMERRVARLKSGFAYAEDPPARTHRAVSNVEIDVTEPDIVVSSVLMLFALSKHKYTIHSARCEFVLKPGDNDDFKIARKKIGLLRNDEALDHIPYLL
ncbi:ring-hydroxylating dioxygenase subunit beta [Methylovirgula ligni]|uniref:Ring hydroxylating enzyme beta subunit n=1 Tax=Methylovirgula ligni TaxID=569860 RepID=A0A3D9Z2S9_9HYPH|nr:aromatic-ring-hydroxylating dioxygenase subunit beta [Methylovirgula ligni]QAY95526.1 ring-hydroxylating dioxygenase subunit beta [Methylovirgula ligni]REF89135.1 ring hydroxylating enzyme beta subunit [Methylovirgula ligni]